MSRFVIVCLLLMASCAWAEPIVVAGDPTYHPFSTLPVVVSHDGNGDCDIARWISSLGTCDVSGFYTNSLHETPNWLGVGVTTFRVTDVVSSAELYRLTAWTDDQWGIDASGCVWILGHVGRFSSCTNGNHFAVFEQVQTPNCVVIGMEDNDGPRADFDRQDVVGYVCGGGSTPPIIPTVPESSSLMLVGMGISLVCWRVKRNGRVYSSL